MTLKKGYDTSGVSDIITAKLKTLTFDDSTLLFKENQFITGDDSNASLYNGNLGFFNMGDLINVEEGLRKEPSWAVHEAYLMVIVSGETKEAKDTRDDMIRIIQNYIDDNPNFESTGFKVYISDNKPVQRRRIAIDVDTNIDNTNITWNSGAIMKLEVGISKQP